MKIAKFLAILSLTVTFNAVHAAEEMAGSQIGVAAYCEEQAELAGIEEANEKKQYLQECIDSFGVPESDVPPTNQ